MFGYKITPDDVAYKTFPKEEFKKFGMSSNEKILPEFIPPFNQLNTNSCVANSATAALSILLGLQGKPVIPLSRLFLYYNARVIDSTTNIDLGCFIPNCFNTLSTLGVCPETIWDFKESMVFKQPNIKAYKYGNDNKINAYYRITGNRVDEIVSAINASHPIVFGTAVNRNFCDNTFNNKDYIVSTPLGNTVGNHSMLIVGYKIVDGNTLFRIRNSWSKGWGEQGYCWFDESYINSYLSRDFWVPTNIPELVF